MNTGFNEWRILTEFRDDIIDPSFIDEVRFDFMGFYVIRT
jgi:hypothetical protein